MIKSKVNEGTKISFYIENHFDIDPSLTEKKKDNLRKHFKNLENIS